MDRYQLIEYVRRRLGHPVVKVELDESQIVDEINYSRKKFIKWACGQATEEYYFTLLLSGGQCVYDLPEGVTEVISVNDKGSSMYGGINTLFSLENYLYMNGSLNPWNLGGGGQDGVNPIVNYHITLDYLETIQMYTPSTYNWTYFNDQNQIQLNPCPPVSGGCLSVCTSGASGYSLQSIDSPGYILIKSTAIKGSTLPGYNPETIYNNLYDRNWIQDYIVARCKIILGMIRRKFANFNSIGNTGISLDGSELIQEGKEEIEKLEETLREEENYCGMPILMG